MKGRAMNQQKPFTRRSFMKYSAGTLTGLSLWPATSSWAGANDRVRVAVIGINGMGRSHISSYMGLPNVEVAAICDVDENLFEQRIKQLFVDKDKPRPKTYTDIRKLLEDKSIDAVSIVTPNHWHALAAIWAIQAGKHVSVEKPCCHNFFEGQKLVEASKKYSVIVQDGAEQRSNPCAQSAADFLQSGGLGEVYLSKGLCYKWRKTIGKTPDEPVPPGVHYDLWLGPAPKRPFSRNRFHYNWHWNFEYGNGDMGNQGAHEIDVARWLLGVTLPTKVSAIGGHFMFDDDQNTPNTIMAMFEFPNEKGGGDRKKILQFEVRHWITNREDAMWMKPDENAPTGYMISAANTIGNLVYGSKGYMAKTVGNWQTYMGRKGEPGPTGSGTGNHYQNFVNAIREGDPRTFNKSIEEGFYTCALVHLANISYRLGRSLDFDPKTQRIINDDHANAMLTREYRKPFVVPDKV
jgi:predicted dehydrogenase